MNEIERLTQMGRESPQQPVTIDVTDAVIATLQHGRRPAEAKGRSYFVAVAASWTVALILAFMALQVYSSAENWLGTPTLADITVFQ